jgi:hypothetical protein
MPVGGRVGAVARATLSARGTGGTARSTGCAGARDADTRATVGAQVASARGCDTAGAVITCLAGGAAAPAAPTAAVTATRLARAVYRRAARSAADTHLARRTRDTRADRGIAVLTLAGIAGTSQAGRTTDVSCRAAEAVKTETRTAVIVRRAGSVSRGTDAGLGCRVANVRAAVAVARASQIVVRNTGDAG